MNYDSPPRGPFSIYTIENDENDPDFFFFRLDPALIRSGRVDYKQYIGACSDRQLSQMFLRFRHDSTDEDAQRFVDRVREGSKSVVPARLQEFFLVHRHKELNDVFQHINDLWQDVQNNI